jgi:hypothetical protein
VKVVDSIPKVEETEKMNSINMQVYHCTTRCSIS